MNNRAQSPSSPAIMTMDVAFVIHYMEGLSSLQRTWLDSERGLNTLAFGMQIEYLIRLIPDRELQRTIQAERIKLQEEFRRDNVDHPIERAGLLIVTYLIEFICNSFDLISINILGPATSKQYRDAVLDVPDMPPGFVTALIPITEETEAS